MIGDRTRRYQDVLRRVEMDLDEFEQSLAALGKVNGVTTKIAVERAANRVQPKAVQMIRTNFHKAGLKSRTGKLLGDIGRVIVRYTARKGLMVQMPTDAKAYDGGVSPYVVQASLEHGAVRMPSINRDIIDVPTGRLVKGYVKAPQLGGRAKRSLKKKALGGTLSVQAERNLARGYSRRGRQLTKGVKEGIATVVPPKPFFRLSESQKSSLRADWITAFFEEVKSLVGV